MTNWAGEIRRAVEVVDRWIERAGADGWLRPREAVWNNKDLLGHLTAWSDLLIDQVEALHQQRLDTIRAVDVDAWNAVEVAKRRPWSSEAIVEDWRRSARRAGDVIHRVPAHAWLERWRVPWTDRPVSIGDLVRLWLAHVAQHRARLPGSGLE